MTAKIIDVQAGGLRNTAELKEKVAQLKAKGVTPGLAVILSGTIRRRSRM
jgi:5,10-methylene-tetrahydrofolate dehydrogenase/methenyl tetrahydrofolate cyclohydrolase